MPSFTARKRPESRSPCRAYAPPAGNRSYGPLDQGSRTKATDFDLNIAGADGGLPGGAPQTSGPRTSAEARMRVLDSMRAVAKSLQWLSSWRGSSKARYRTPGRTKKRLYGRFPPRTEPLLPRAARNRAATAAADHRSVPAGCRARLCALCAHAETGCSRGLYSSFGVAHSIN
jgi:hypothetical protein